MVVCIIILGVWLIIVKERERKLKGNREKLVKLIKEMLERQIQILDKQSNNCITLEQEISKFLKDCMIERLMEGEYYSYDERRAHGWLKKEFTEGFEIFIEGSQK